MHAWERIGALLAHIARKCLKIALCRYVNDFFGCERQVPVTLKYVCVCVCSAGVLVWHRLETVEHALGCLVRLIRLILGRGSVAAHEVACGSALCVLGVDMVLSITG